VRIDDDVDEAIGGNKERPMYSFLINPSFNPSERAAADSLLLANMSKPDVS
jgi:hypothetical protein